MEERSRSFSYLIAMGSVGQTFAAVVRQIYETNVEYSRCIVVFSSVHI